jgi:hypothetical protein
MSLKTRTQALATRIAEEINDVRDEITASQSDSNIDGGDASEVFETDLNITGGNANGT